MPYLYHVDESAYVRTAVRLLQGNLTTRPYDPTGFSNILFLEYAALYGLGRVFGIFQSIEEFAVVWPGNRLTAFILLGRYTSAVLGTATVAVVYVLGARLRSRVMGILAAAFLAVSFLHVRDSHYGVPDVSMAFFVVLSITLYVISLDTQSGRDLLLAGIAGGLAVATKWIALPVVLSALIVAFMSRDTSKEPEAGSVPLRSLVISASGLALGFALGSPQIILRPGQYWVKVVEEYLKTAVDSGIWQVDTVPGWLYYVKTLSYGQGPALLLLGLLGACERMLSIRRTRDARSVLVLSFPALYFLLMGSNRHYAWRYALPLVPFVALFAADAVVIGSTWGQTRRNKLAIVLTGAVVSLMIVQPLSQSIRHDVLLTRVDTRTLAKTWIEANIPIGAKVVLDWPVFSPPLYGSWSLVPYSAEAYDILVVGERGVPRHPLDWYRDQGYEYAVITSYVYNIQWTTQDSDRREYYASLDRELELIRIFCPFGDSEPPSVSDEMYGPTIRLWERERPGPRIKIYEFPQQHMSPMALEAGSS